MLLRESVKREEKSSEPWGTATLRENGKRRNIWETEIQQAAREEENQEIGEALKPRKTFQGQTDTRCQ